jgi:hypothetical protein
MTDPLPTASYTRLLALDRSDRVERARRIAQSACTASILERLPSDECALVEHDRQSPRRADVESFIRCEYAQHFGARLKSFTPTLLALHGSDGQIRGAVGCRGAQEGRLFLETYTGVPIEHAIAARLGVSLPRSEIVEVGSLACRSGRSTVALIRALVPYLVSAGFSWVVFTGADTIVNVFRRLDLEPTPLCRADRRLLGDAQHDWGNYYEHNPIVMTGPLIDGISALGIEPGVQ